MNNFLALLKVQVLSLFGINKIAHKKKGNKSELSKILSIATLFLVLIIAVAYVYAKMYAEMYIALGKAETYLPTMFALSSMVCLIFSFYSSNGNIYHAKDYDLLSALPIKANTIILSKLIFTYFADLIFCLIILIVSVVVHFKLIGSIIAINLVRLFIMAIFSPIYPMIVAMLLGVVISYLSSKFRRKNLVQSLLYSIFFIGAYALSMIGTDFEDSLGVIRKIYFLFPWIEQGIYNFKFVGLFCGVALGVFIGLIAFASLTYGKLNTALKSFKKSKKFELKKYEKKGQFRVLLKKEISLLFSSAIYVMNTLMGSIITILATIIFIVLLLENKQSEVAMIFSIIMQSVFAFSLMISPTTAPSISIEGGKFYLMRTCPISAKKLLNAKLFVNIIFATIPALVCSIAFSFTMIGAPILFILLTILNAPLYSILGGNLGLLFNLLFPNLKWDNVNKAVKQGFAVFLTIISGMIMAGLTFVILYFVQIEVQFRLLIIFAFLTITSIISYLLIMKYGQKLIDKKT